MLAIEHCKGKYYREIAKATPEGSVYRIKKAIDSAEFLEKVLKHSDNGQGMYITIYSFKSLAGHSVNYNTPIIDRIYFDFDDANDPSNAIEDALFTIRMLEKHQIHSIPYFSGKKGIALYIEFNPVNIALENIKDTIAGFFDIVKESAAKEGNPLRTLDPQIRGDYKRVSRLPNTKHKSGLYCIPLNVGDLISGIDHIKEKAKEPAEYNLLGAIRENESKNSIMETILKNLEKKAISDRSKEEQLKKMRQEYIKEQSRRNTKRSGRITDADITKARTIPISSFLGREKKVVCPLHSDTVPSLSLDHDKNLWYCHGCGKGGDVISFVMESDKVDFITAVKKLLEA